MTIRTPSPDQAQKVISTEQAAAFLTALWPSGEQSYLASHARTFLAALIGEVPQMLPDQYWDENSKQPARKLAATLRALADAIDSACARRTP